MSGFSHLDSEGRARMVDVSSKSDTTRIAVAARELATTPEVVALVRADGMPKADVLATARIAGISPSLIVSTAGTGASPTDATPEATAAVLDRELPDVADAIRSKGTHVTPHANLSRGLAGLAGSTVVVNLPGSPGGVKDALAVLDPIVDHLPAQVAGGGLHDDKEGP